MTDLPDGVTVFGDTPPNPAFPSPDPDLSPEDGAGSGLSPLDRLRRRVNIEVDKGTRTIPVPTRPGVALEVDLNIDWNVYADWQFRSRRPKARQEEVDTYRLACFVIGNLTRDILDEGDATGMTFASVELRTILGLEPRASTIDTVKAFFGDRGVAVIGAWGVWSEAAGVDRADYEPDSQDPT